MVALFLHSAIGNYVETIMCMVHNTQNDTKKAPFLAATGWHVRKLLY